MCHSIRCGQSHCDDEICSRKPEEHQDEDFASPTRKEPLKHGNAALAVRASRRNALVDRKSTEQRDKYQNERRNGRKKSGSKECYAGLVSERGKIIDPRQTHHF